ncbi:hypothetical protein ASNO1_36810 [Corallococcus caeni]|uniref:Uncharacterized protein n=1 Tax=Corallococcus caeni TaxID=3082388 RepID=A0ABQ6QTU2_9BACT|nr:hypothetical protein ASNO1_36810 [Corallococcus sp. NO1]
MRGYSSCALSTVYGAASDSGIRGSAIHGMTDFTGETGDDTGAGAMAWSMGV